MGQQLPPLEKELYQRLDEVIHYMWDPIGVSAIPEARDEYYSYLPQVFAMLRQGTDGDAISAYLTAVETERMGLTANTANAKRVADVLLEWAGVLRSKYGANE